MPNGAYGIRESACSVETISVEAPPDGRTSGIHRIVDVEAESVASASNRPLFINHPTMECELPNRTSFSTQDTVSYIWETLGLPPHALSSLELPGSSNLGLPSSFKVGHLAQATIALSALAAALVHAERNNTSGDPNEASVPKVTVPLEHAVVEFKSEQLYTLDSQPPDRSFGLKIVGGLVRTKDGFVKIHPVLPNHHAAALKVLGLDSNATREEAKAKLLEWEAEKLESAALSNGAVIGKLRSYTEWDPLPQAKAVQRFPILIRRIDDGSTDTKKVLHPGATRCLQGFKVVEMSRVVAGPVAGKTLATHGAEVLWVTSPNLPDLPALDRDLARGKRTTQLDIDAPKDKQTLEALLEDADVFIQTYRPGSLAAKGFSPENMAKRSKKGIVYASLSAYGTEGPWKETRGFDSIVQTLSGMNVSEAEHAGDGQPAKVLPCQLLDHMSGYFLATGIIAALYKQMTEGGSWRVDVSLAGAMHYARSLGQLEGKSGFDCKDYNRQSDVPEAFLETRESGFGKLVALRHSASIEGARVGWDLMPKPLGSDPAKWFKGGITSSI